MANQYCYTLKILARKPVDRTKDEESVAAMDTRKKVIEMLNAAGFEIETQTGVFGSHKKAGT